MINNAILLTHFFCYPLLFSHNDFRMITAINSQTFRTSVEESAQYIEVLNDSTIPNSSQGRTFSSFENN